MSLPLRTRSIWNTVPDIRSAVYMLNQGMFNEAALLVDAMMCDDRINGVLSTRTGAIKAAPVECKPAKQKRNAIKIAEELQGTEGVLGRWSSMFPPSAVGEMVKWGLTLGIAVAKIDWRGDGEANRWTPRIIPWHPQFIRFDWPTFTYRVIVWPGQEIVLPRVDENPRSDGDWVVWCPYGYYGGWLMAAVRWLADKYLMRGWDYRDWARYNEVQGAPMKVAYVPEMAEQSEKDDFSAEVANSAAESVVTIPVGDEGREKNGYGVELIEATARTFETFQLFKQELDTDIAVGLLGQNLTTEVQGGSLAAAKEHTLVRIDKAREDAALGPVLRDQVLTHWAKANFGDEELAPIVEFVVEPPADEKEEAAALEGMGKALQALELGAPGMVDKRAILDHNGVPLLTEEEMAAAAAEKMEQSIQMAQRMAEAGGGQGPGGNGGPPAGGGRPGGPAGGPPRPPTPGDKGPTKTTALSATAAPVKRYTFQGLPIAIENERGTRRAWKDEATGESGETLMRNDYGFIEGWLGADGDEIDVYVGGDENAKEVHVIRQAKKPDYKTFDEDKVFMGFLSADAARAAYVAHRDDGDKPIMGVQSFPLEAFKKKLKRRDPETTTRIRLSAIAAAERATNQLIAIATRGRKPTALRSIAGGKRAARYPDRLETNAVRAAAKELAPFVAALGRAVDGAKSLEDVKRMVLAAYRKAEPDDLAEVIRRANVLANAAGRDSAQP